MATESISFEIAPVYGQAGVELSGLAANFDGVEVEQDGNDSERSFSMFNGSLVTAKGVSLHRWRTFLVFERRIDLGNEHSGKKNRIYRQNKKHKAK